MAGWRRVWGEKCLEAGKTVRVHIGVESAGFGFPSASHALSGHGSGCIQKVISDGVFQEFNASRQLSSRDTSYKIQRRLVREARLLTIPYL